MKDDRTQAELVRELLNQVLSPKSCAQKYSSHPSLTDTLSQLDALANNDQLAIDPKLRHYLQRRSYQKAWALLNASK